MATIAKARLVDAACRTHFPSFCRKCFHIVNPGREYYPGWYSHALGYHLEQVRRGRIKRLIINTPPRIGKSLMTSVALPAFALGHDPTTRFLVICHNADLAGKQHSDFRAVVESDWYQKRFPAMRIARSTEFETVTDQRGYRRAASMDGTLTGIGGDIIIIDDYIKAGDVVSDNKRATANNLFFNTVLSRLDNKRTGAIVVVGQRLHNDDLTAVLLRSADNWARLSLPAIAEQEQRVPISDSEWYIRPVGDVLQPELLPLDELHSIREYSVEMYAAQYQQNPLPPGGLIIKPEWIRDYDQLPRLTPASVFVQSWDPGLKPGEANSRSACTTWLFHENNYYLVDVVAGQFDYPTLRERAISLARSYKPFAILIEDTLMGAPLITELKKAGLPAETVKQPSQDKAGRLFVHVPKFANGQVFFPKGKPWRSEVEAELFSFPGGRSTDIVDSTTQALTYDPNRFDAVKYFKALSNLHSALWFEQRFRGRVV